ncbi:hypothetical protein DMUE_3703 [Dictyocoela muelleri]|nr:hypothetical protein DMUE_3703 [Dictyocoela muelleri]
MWYTTSFAFYKIYITFRSERNIFRIFSHKGQTCKEDIANAVINCIIKHFILLDKIVSILTVGAGSMAGIRKGYVSILRKNYILILAYGWEPIAPKAPFALPPNRRKIITKFLTPIKMQYNDLFLTKTKKNKKSCI